MSAARYRMRLRVFPAQQIEAPADGNRVIAGASGYVTACDRECAALAAAHLGHELVGSWIGYADALSSCDHCGEVPA